MTNKFLEHDFFLDKKILITGHTGFKGAWLSLWLHKLGSRVFGFALDPPSSPNLYDSIRADTFVKSNISDIRNFEMLKNVVLKIQPEIIIHMAAQSLVRKSYENPLFTYETNVMGTVNLLEATRSCGKVKVILNVTTDKCYENKEWDWGYRENDRLGGHDPYSNSKACSELITASYRNSFFEKTENSTLLATARSGNIIGGGDWSKDRLVPDFIRSIQKKEKVVIRNPGAIRPWQYVLDSLSGYLNLVEKLYTKGSAYAESWNFGPSEKSHQTVEWMITELCRKWGDDASFEIDSRKAVHEANFLKLDSSKAKNRLNWSNKYSLKKGLSKTADWYMRYLNGENARQICEKHIDEFMTSV